MNVSKDNIYIEYCYRDGYNYKVWGECLIQNTMTCNSSVLLSTLDEFIESSMFFYPENWGIRSLVTDSYNPSTDPTWHEILALRTTAKQIANIDTYDIRDILGNLGKLRSSKIVIG